MTGVTTGDCKKFQLKNKLHIPANVILDVVQMVSVVATGCHVSFNVTLKMCHIIPVLLFQRAFFKCTVFL